MSRARTEARELALQALYQYDLRGEDARDAVTALMSAAEPETRTYAQTLVEGVREHEADLTKALQGLVENWAWERVAAIDRSILRIGAFELLHVPETPPKVALDEAIELAKRYSTRDSGAFVNGILDRLYHGRATAAG